MPKPSKQKSVGGVGSYQVFVFGVGSEGLLAECSAQREDPPRNGFLFDKVPFDHSLHSLHNQQTLGGGGAVLLPVLLPGSLQLGGGVFLRPCKLSGGYC